MVLQKFNIEKADPTYSLDLTGQMGVKPVGFKIKVRRRPGRGLMFGIPGGGANQEKHHIQQQKGVTVKYENKKPVSVFWGGNMGTSENLVQSFTRIAPEFGLDIVDIRELDTAIGNLPTDRPSIIITPSYEGRPPDNAKGFVAWIEHMLAKGEKLPSGTQFAVFGVGNSDWNTTFHRVPILIDNILQLLGANQIMKPGFANVKRDLAGPWETWNEQLCISLSGTTGHDNTAGVDVRVESRRPNTLPQELGGEQMVMGVVTSNRKLADTSIGPAKVHVEVRLPPGCEYKAGDYLVVQGRNSHETVFRVLNRFCLNPEDVMSVHSSKKDFLPAQPMSVQHFLCGSVELAAPVTERQLATLASWADADSTECIQLQKMQNHDHYQELLDKRYSIIDVLEDIPDLHLPFGVFIDLLLPLSPRVYSISSSPVDPENSSKHGLIASVTFDVFEGPARSGHGTFRGVASSHLSNSVPGDSISCLVRQTKLNFRLPQSTETPIIMICAGSGIAPMRAFIQERAIIERTSKHKLGPTLLFFGSRNPDSDYLYRSELAAWERQGIVKIIPCFSKPSNGQEGRHVSDALWEHRDSIWNMFCNGAKVYTCGSAARLGRSSAATWRNIWCEKTGQSDAEAHEWLDQVKNDRYVSDVY